MKNWKSKAWWLWLGLDHKATDIKVDRAGIQAVADADKHNPT